MLIKQTMLKNDFYNNTLITNTLTAMIKAFFVCKYSRFSFIFLK